MPARHRVLFRLCVLAIALATAGCSGNPTSPSANPAFQFSLTPVTVAAGASSQGTVTLTAPTLSALRIDLTSSDAVAAVPASVILPAGDTTTSFTITTRVVAADTTTQHAVNQALSTIESCEIVLMMLNKARKTDVGSYYGYYADDDAR